MNLTDLCTRHWPSVAAAVALVALFGLTSIASLPIQLLPTIEEPQISVANFWRAAAPEEMEANIVEPQENVLRNTPGVTNLNSFIGRGTGFVNLTFAVGTDIQTAKLDVINNLNQAPPRPGDALEPQVNVGGGGQTPGAASLLIRVLPDNPNRELSSYQKLIEDTVEPRLARIPGVSQVNLQGEQPRELHITFDAYRAAALGVQINDIIATVSRATDSSGGFADVGRRQYTVRFVGKFEPERLNELIVGWSNERPIYLNEVADVDIVPRKQDGFTLRNGYPAYYITVQRDYDANTVTILDEVNKAIVELNDNVLHAAGLEMDLSFDASIHIRRAISLVRSNLGLGLLLAVGILYFLMRSRRATFLVTATVPLSVLVAFVALRFFDKSLNVISLAGLAFSVGLVMDAAIVTLENIVRCRQAGLSHKESVAKGTRQITGALFASTVTSVAIFVPVLFMQGMEGQLFQDLALTIAVAVSASFFIAITVLPVAAGFLLRKEADDPLEHWWDRITGLVMKLTRTPFMCGSWIAGILGASLLVIFLLVPKANLLPQAPADSLNAFFAMPPGGTVEMVETEIAGTIVERLRPYMEHRQEPHIRGYNLSSFGTFNALFIYPQDPNRIEQMVGIVRDEILVDLPDTQAFVQRSSLLNFGFDGGRSINVDLQGSNINDLSNVAMQAMPIINEAIPGAQVRPNPGLQVAEPELQLLPNDRRITAAGLDRAAIANTVRALTSGAFVGEYFDGNDRMDMILKGPAWNSPEALAAMPIATPLAGIQSIGELTDIRRTVGPTQLLRVNGQRTLTLAVTPPPEMTVQEALDTLRNVVDPQLREIMPGDVSLAYRGTADRLEEAFDTMRANLAIAAIVLFLVLAAMFRSLWDGALVMLSMPLAIAGGVISLRVLNLFTTQAMDLLTTIGFLILLGLVVNNAILLVMQTRTGQDNGLERSAAVAAAVRMRARPIYMSTLTSIFGMLPLMLVPGVGSQIYRGLATVIIGGMFVSALFTLILMPSILRLAPFSISLRGKEKATVTEGVIADA
ncbi:MAG: efflux RND transporter permease subunit [Gammaproteobacteria bacterium]|nr:efflux RND transporter permease subunit [Gammaproteobacteria bacterium]MDH5617388.1 efflux RND transporter permease subunit [Gammaproteobacteria bacterium]